MRNLKLSAVFLFAALTIGCGTNTRDVEDNTSGLHYITFGPGVSGLVSKVKNAAMTACLSGHNAADRETWSKNIESSVLKWIEPLRRLTGTKLTSRVEVVDGRGRCDMDIVVAPNTHSNTSVGRTPTVRMSPTGYFASYNVLLHEFGHAFALSDTYQNGQSGNCKPGQPQAVMCNTRFPDLQTDDVAGVQEVFRRVFPRDVPGGNGDQPNPGGSIPDNTPLSIATAVAIGKSSSTDTYEIVAGISGSEAGGSVSLSYCRKNCSAETSWVRMAYVRPQAGSFLFSAGSLAIQDGDRFEFRANSGNRKKSSAVEFKAR